MERDENREGEKEGQKEREVERDENRGVGINSFPTDLLAGEFSPLP